MDKAVLTGPIIKTFLSYAIPSILGLLAITTASIVDGIFVGQFVSAKIHGGLAQQSFRIPRSALRQRQQLWLADEEGALRIIAAEVVQSDSDSAIVRVPNQRELRLVLSELSLPIEGMSLTVVERPAVADRPQATTSAAGDLPATADSQD